MAPLTYNVPMIDWAEKHLADIPVVVLDTETTGLFPGLGHRVVEIGAIRLENGRVTAEVSQLLQPDRKMDPRATAVNGISDEDLLGQPSFAEISGGLRVMLQGALLVAHNATFDAEFLAMEFYIAQLGRAANDDWPLPNPWLCTLELARRYFYFGRNNLEHIAYRLGVRMGQAHRALNDVYMTAEILKRMVRELHHHRLETVGDLLFAQGGAIYAKPPLPPMVPDLISQAIAAQCQLRIRYLGPGGETERAITPRYVSHYGDRAYLVAFCHLRLEQRTFRLDRIIDVQTITLP